MLKDSKKLSGKTLTLLIAAVVIIGLLIVAVVTGGVNNLLPCPDCVEGLIDGVECETCGGTASVIGSFWALLPPIIAIGLALITKEVFSSLFIGILSGAILVGDWNPLTT